MLKSSFYYSESESESESRIWTYRRDHSFQWHAPKILSLYSKLENNSIRKSVRSIAHDHTYIIQRFATFTFHVPLSDAYVTY